MPKGAYTLDDVDQAAPRYTAADIDTSHPENKGAIDRLQSSFDENIKYNANDSMLKKFLTGTVNAVGSPIIHPIDTAAGIVKSASTLADGILDPQHPQTWSQAGQHLPYDAGQFVGGAALGEVGGAGLRSSIPVARAIGRTISGAADSTSEAFGNATQKLYPRSKNIDPAESGARDLAKALVVPTIAAKSFVNAATSEAGNILGYAKRTGLPINSTLDFAKAAEGAAREVQDFYSKEVLGPNADVQVSVPGDYRGPKIGEGNRATLAAVENRVNAINQELSPNYRKATAMQQNAANVSDADLIAEKRALTSVLHDKLGDLNGVEPEEIAALRQRAGKLRTIADEATLSANQDTVSAGKQARGRSDIPTGTKMGLIERGIQELRGGPEIIGNRAVNSALKKVVPTDTPLPELNTPDAIINTRVPVWTGPAYERPPVMGLPDNSSTLAEMQQRMEARISSNSQRSQQAALRSQYNRASHGPNATKLSFDEWLRSKR